MKIIIKDNYDQLSQAAFEVIKDQILTKPDSVLGLATGSTPEGLYSLMARDHENGQSYAQVKSFNLDEYAGMSPEHEQSYHFFMKDKLFDYLDIPQQNIHIPSGSLPEDAAAYDVLLSAQPVDLQILGLGHNGHIGFNEPGTDFESRTHLTDLTERTRKANQRFFRDEPVPEQAITQGIGNIMEAGKILMLASGKDKAPAVRAMIEGEITPDVPASILQKHPDVIVILDQEAASLLERKGCE